MALGWCYGMLYDQRTAGPRHQALLRQGQVHRGLHALAVFGVRRFPPKTARASRHSSSRSIPPETAHSATMALQISRRLTSLDGPRLALRGAPEPRPRVGVFARRPGEALVHALTQRRRQQRQDALDAVRADPLEAEAAGDRLGQALHVHGALRGDALLQGAHHEPSVVRAGQPVEGHPRAERPRLPRCEHRLAVHQGRGSGGYLRGLGRADEVRLGCGRTHRCRHVRGCQNATSARSATGQRYVHHREQGSHVVLFAREAPTDEVGAAPFLCLGAADHVSHRGERPMAITWRTHRPMPADVVQAASAASA